MKHLITDWKTFQEYTNTKSHYRCWLPWENTYEKKKDPFTYPKFLPRNWRLFWKKFYSEVRKRSFETLNSLTFPFFFHVNFASCELGMFLPWLLKLSSLDTVFPVPYLINISISFLPVFPQSDRNQNCTCYWN